MSDLRGIYKIGDRVDVTFDSYGLGTVVGFSEIGSVQVCLDSGKNEREENGNRFSQFGEKSSLHKIDSNTKEAKVMSKTEFKVGDKVVVMNHGYGGLTGNGKYIGLLKDGRLNIAVEYDNNLGEFFHELGFDSNSVQKASNSFKVNSKQPVVLTVKGHTPKLVIKIGCKEFEYETAEKLANKLLRVAKAHKETPEVGTPEIQGESFTEEDIKNFLAWFKTTKKGK